MIRTKLRDRRQQLGLRQSEVAEIIGVTRAYYSRLETGTRQGTIQLWQKLADALHWPPDRLGELMYNTNKEE